MNVWSVRALLPDESVSPGHHVPDGLEWLPLVGLAIFAVALVSAFVSRAPDRSDGDGSDDD